MDELKKVLAEELASHELLICTRVWEAWGYGTMDSDDFVDASGEDEVIEEIAQALYNAGFRKD